MDKKNLQDKIRNVKLALLAASAIGGSSLNASAQTTTENRTKTNTIEHNQSNTKTITPSFGNITYSVTDNGIEYKDNATPNVLSIMPNLYDYDDGRIGCGPLKSYLESVLRDHSMFELRRVVVEEAIAQDIQNKSGIISKSEQNFLTAHNKQMNDWGLTAKNSNNGKIEITQKDTRRGGHLTFYMNAAQNARQVDFSR